MANKDCTDDIANPRGSRARISKTDLFGLNGKPPKKVKANEVNGQLSGHRLVVCRAVAKLRKGHGLIAQACNELDGLAVSFVKADWLIPPRPPRISHQQKSESEGGLRENAAPDLTIHSGKEALPPGFTSQGLPINEVKEMSADGGKGNHENKMVRLQEDCQDLEGSEESKGTVLPAQTISDKLNRGYSFGKFVELATSTSIESEQASFASIVLEHPVTQIISVSLIFLTMILICMDTNARAQGAASDAWEDIAMTICFVAYVIEFGAYIYVWRGNLIYDMWVYMDSVVIATSILGYILSTFAGAEGMALLRLLRLFRLLRLGRIFRNLKLMQNVKWFKEPYMLMMMLASSFRTLMWALILVIFLFTLWSIVAVELLNEVVRELAVSTSSWEDCDHCSDSFTSIWNANLLFFQTIVAGDSWGVVALPVIQETWWSAFIFVGALSTTIFGILNMVAVVVIDTFAERRAKDVSRIANELEFEEIFERNRLEKMFEKIDEDQSGALSKQELYKGAGRCQEFREYLRVLDIDDKDLNELFDMLDNDGDGEIDPGEFISALYRMKSTESKTATRFVKHMVSNLHDKQQDVNERLVKLQDKITTRLDDVEKQFTKELEDNQNPEKIQELLTAHTGNIENTLSLAIDKVVSVAFDSLVGSAASHASDAIQKAVFASSNQAVALAGRARWSEFASPDSSASIMTSRQVSKMSGYSDSDFASLPLFQPRRSTLACLPQSLQKDYDKVGRRNAVVSLGEDLMPGIDENALDCFTDLS